jgi:hypothetical protein
MAAGVKGNYEKNVSFFEYFIVTDIQNPTGIHCNLGQDLFAKLNRFYQNKCMDQAPQIWKCRILFHRIYVKKTYMDYILEVCDVPVCYRQICLPIVTTFQKKGIYFLKRTVYKQPLPIPSYLDVTPLDFSEMNEIIFEMNNLNSSETYYIKLCCQTNMRSPSDTIYSVSFVTHSHQPFFMLLPFYLWQDNSKKRISREFSECAEETEALERPGTLSSTTTKRTMISKNKKQRWHKHNSQRSEASYDCGTRGHRFRHSESTFAEIHEKSTP